MEISRQENRIYLTPKSKNTEEYPYSSSSKIFQTDQLFLYSEKIAPGKRSSAPHFHRLIDEIIVVTKGELHAFEDEKEVLLREGDSVCFFANSEKNIS